MSNAIDGRLRISAGEPESARLLSRRAIIRKVGPGEPIVLGSAIGHEVGALEESACLLALAKASEEAKGKDAGSGI